MINEYEIYQFCDEQWKKLIQEDGGYSPSKHDDKVLGLAAEKFDTTKEDIDKIFQKVSYEVELKKVKGMSQEQIKKELNKIIQNNKDLKLK